MKDMKRTATIILNRNLPSVVDQLYESLNKHNNDNNDIYVVEAGSDEDKLSAHCTWWANWNEVKDDGLRAPRGFNYGLSQLLKEDKYHQYDSFFLLTNDTEFDDVPVLELLREELAKHERVGILSPCSRRWGEKILLANMETKYFWYVHNTAYLIRREFIDSIRELDEPDYMNFLYDGSNFRGCFTETELIAKGYANDWATAITTKVWAEENESYLRDKADLIKTESFERNLDEYLEEGERWIRKKYGFNSRWSMQMYAKFWYERFFEYYPELSRYRI